MANKTLAELQQQWFAEDTGASGSDPNANPLTDLFPQLSNLFTSTKVSSSTSNAYGVSGAGGFTFANPQTAASNQNNAKEFTLIAGALIAVLLTAVILKAAR